MKAELTNAEIEKRVKEMPLAGNLLSIVRMVKLYLLTKERPGANSNLALKRITMLTKGKNFDYALAEYIMRNTGLMVTVK